MNSPHEGLRIRALSASAERISYGRSRPLASFRSVCCKIRESRATRPPLQLQFTRRCVLQTQVDASATQRQASGRRRFQPRLQRNGGAQ
jgi:hypothetical protein